MTLKLYIRILLAKIAINYWRFLTFFIVIIFLYIRLCSFFFKSICKSIPLEFNCISSLFFLSKKIRCLSKNCIFASWEISFLDTFINYRLIMIILKFFLWSFLSFQIYFYWRTFSWIDLLLNSNLLSFYLIFVDDSL